MAHDRELTRSQEAKKQSVDQLAHMAWGAAAGGIPWVMLWGLGPYGAMAGAALNAGCGWYWTRRERLQFRDGARKPWDPILDNSMFWAGHLISAVLGIILAT